MYAAEAEVIDVLLQHGADAAARDHDGKTALMYSVERSDFIETTSALLKLSADLSVRSKTGKTALCFAAENHNSEGIRLLKQAGART